MCLKQSRSSRNDAVSLFFTASTRLFIFLLCSWFVCIRFFALFPVFSLQLKKPMYQNYIINRYNNNYTKTYTFVNTFFGKYTIIVQIHRQILYNLCKSYYIVSIFLQNNAGFATTCHFSTNKKTEVRMFTPVISLLYFYRFLFASALYTIAAPTRVIISSGSIYAPLYATE